MTRLRTSVIAAAALIVVFMQPSGNIDAHQQVRDQRAAPPAPGPTGTAVLSGIVTSEDGGRPVRNAYLVLLGSGTGTVKVSSSDADGRFTFANLPADRYTLGASKPPYLGTVAGARRPGRSGTPIAIADGQKLSNVAVRMPMGASISGVITDERGQPAPSVQVIVQQLRMVNGERTLVTPPGVPSTASTDERGRYRVFGLLPGEYMVTANRGGSPPTVPRLATTDVDAALRNPNAVMAVPVAPVSTVRYAAVYYPGTTRAANAAPVALGPGEDRINIDFKLEAVPTSRVEGVVNTVDGEGLPNGSVLLVSAGSSAIRSTQVGRVVTDGRFSFGGVSPGTYTIYWSGSAGPAGNRYAAATVEVAGADVLGLQLTLRPMMNLPARIEIHGATATPALGGRRIAVRALTALSGAPAPSVTTTTDTGAFTITNIMPGTYVIGAPLSFGPTTDSMTWALDSVIADGHDITDRPIEITAESLPKDLVVTYSDKFQELSGRLRRADGTGVSDYTVLVFPEDKTLWVTGSRRIVTTRPGTDGRFSLSGPGPTTLPAGKYLLAAVTDIDRNEQFDPAFLASIVPAAAPITLQASEKKIQDLIVK
jgi:hypothetical protein